MVGLVGVVEWRGGSGGGSRVVGLVGVVEWRGGSGGGSSGEVGLVGVVEWWVWWG